MDTGHIISELSRNGNVFRALLEGLTGDAITWKQAPGKWCLLEIVCHLHDEEREDFRARIGHAFSGNCDSIPPLDPEAWVTERKYMQQDYPTVLGKFLAEREESIHWLQSLDHAGWKKTCEHPEFGPISAEFLLANWLAHDYLHFRQITRVKYDYLEAHTGVSLSYAGDW